MSTSSESRTPNPESRLADLIRDRGPLTVAAFMELALYDPGLGYYARAAQRSGRAGDFFTSVDVGPLFGELLEVQLAEMFEILRGGHMGPPLHGHLFPNRSVYDVGADQRVRPFDVVEAGAGNGRLSADILRAARRGHPDFYNAIRLHLVEASAEARRAQRATLGDVADRLISSESTLPSPFEGVLIANELLDAMPVHQVVMREDGLREVYVDARSPKGSRSSDDGARGFFSDREAQGFSRAELTIVEGPPSTPALAEYLDRVGARLEPGWRVEINLRAVEWMRDAARRLRRGFIVIIDYGHEARELYSASHSAGTLTTFTAHRSAGPESRPDTPPWLQHPGEQDITSHVDFTSVRAATEAEGLETLGFLDQTYFLLGLLEASGSLEPLRGADAPSNSAGGGVPGAIRKRGAPREMGKALGLKTLLMPGALGSSHKVLLLGRAVGTPALKGCSFRMRVT